MSKKNRKQLNVFSAEYDSEPEPVMALDEYQAWVAAGEPEPDLNAIAADLGLAIVNGEVMRPIREKIPCDCEDQTEQPGNSLPMSLVPLAPAITLVEAVERPALAPERLPVGTGAARELPINDLGTGSEIIALPGEIEEETMDTKNEETIVSPIADVLQKSFEAGHPAIIRYTDLDGNRSTRSVQVVSPVTTRFVAWDEKRQKLICFYTEAVSLATLDISERWGVAKKLSGYSKWPVLITPATAETQRFGRPMWVSEVCAESYSGRGWTRV